MRKLKTSDVFAFMRVVRVAGIRDEVIRIGLLVNEGKVLDISEVGAEFILACIEKCAGTEAEKAIYSFLGGLIEISPAEVAEMDPFKLLNELMTLKEYVTSEEATAFFHSVELLMAKLP